MAVAACLDWSWKASRSKNYGVFERVGGDELAGCGGRASSVAAAVQSPRRHDVRGIAGVGAWALVLIAAALPAAAVRAAAPAESSVALAHEEPALTDAGAATTIRAMRLMPGEHIVLDGTLSSPAWQRAPVYDRFFELEPSRGARPREATRVQVLFDDEALYVGVAALDAHPEQIRAPLVRHDGVTRAQDFVLLCIDAIGKRQSAQFFRVSASGSLADGMYTAADDDEDFAPDFDFDAAAARDEHGYTAVFRIPFASLRYSSDARATWRIMVARRMPREQSYLWASVELPLDSTAFISAMQPLQGVALPTQREFLSLRPSVTLRHASSQEPGEARHASTGVQGSLDVKWRATPELVVDGTLRPDFSQVALDVPQLSGNAQFALFVPEKRPFFFESSDLLHSPTEALYTRTFTQPRWGLRSTWRGAALAGTAFAVDDKGGGLTLLPGAYDTGTALQPASRTLAARVRGDVEDAGGLELGGILAARRYEGGRGDNLVAGPDFVWQPDAWHVRGQWLHSGTTAQPDADGSLSGGARTSGDSLTLKAQRLDDRTQLEFEAHDIGPGFRHDSGFVNQVGVRDLKLHQALIFRDLGPTNEFWLSLFERMVREHGNGRLVQAFVVPEVWLSGSHGLQAWLDWDRFSRVRTSASGRLLRENFWEGDLNVTPATWAPLLKAHANVGRMADVVAGVVRPGAQVNLDLTTRPLARLELEPSVWAAWLKNGPQLAYRETASQLLGVWHFDARQSLRLIVQRTTVDRKAEPDLGVAVDRRSGLTGSLTYAFRRSMGTVLYVGASRSHDGVGAENIARGTEVFVKLQADVGGASGVRSPSDESTSLGEPRPVSSSY